MDSNLEGKDLRKLFLIGLKFWVERMCQETNMVSLNAMLRHLKQRVSDFRELYQQQKKQFFPHYSKRVFWQLCLSYHVC